MLIVVKNRLVKDITLYFKLEKFFDLIYLQNALRSNLKSFNKYTFLFKISYNQEGRYTEYKMLGEQIPFYFESDSDLSDQINDFW